MLQQLVHWLEKLTSKEGLNVLPVLRQLTFGVSQHRNLALGLDGIFRLPALHPRHHQFINH